MQNESLKDRTRRYEEIIETQCKANCKAYKPRTKNQCNICKHLLIAQDSDLVAQEAIMIDGTKCKGYVAKIKEE